MSRRHQLAAATLAAIVAGVPAGAAAHHPARPLTTTSYATIEGATDAPYARLRYGPGWRRVVRDDLAAPVRGRSARRRSLLYFAQLSDFQLADEESPARVESLDLASTPFTAAWRPQEALGPHTVDQVIRHVNRFARSPVRTRRLRGGRRTFANLALAVLTGDNADNQQVNEMAWVVRLLEGGRLDPNSGVEPEAPCPAGPIPAGEARRYTGVQDDDDVLESGRFYDPDAPSGTFAAFPRYPGLMDRAQEPFDAEGLRVPSYVSFDNHDLMVQGNVSANAAFDAVAVSCVKPLHPQGLAPSALTTTPERVVAVPPDPARAFASRAAAMELHRTGAQPDAHGFGHVAPAEAAASAGHAAYYAFSPRPGLRMIALNTVGEGAAAFPNPEGNLDDPQFQWLSRELEAARSRGELVIAFGHHSIRTLTNTTPDELARPCSDPTAGPGCDGDPRNSGPIRLGADLERLFLEHRNVVAYVAGHTHEHKVTPFEREGGGGFWGIETASEVDWPIQSRLLELMDNGDGTLSIFGTILDHAAPLATPASGTPATAFGPETLASIARELSFNDPQAGAPGGEGTPSDRNVELLLPDPRGG